MDKEENAVVSEKNKKIIEPACVALPTEQWLNEIREGQKLWIKSLKLDENEVKWAKGFNAKVHSGENPDIYTGDFTQEKNIDERKYTRCAHEREGIFAAL